MAERRMVAKTIVDSDTFLDMSQSAQLLYFHLCMRADDEGFINNPKRIMRDVRCGDDDMKILIAKKYIIPFESGVIVIRHWKIHNYIQKDRYKPSLCEEKKLLHTNEDKVYEVLDTERIQDGYKMDTERIQTVRVGKVSLDQNKLNNNHQANNVRSDSEQCDSKKSKSEADLKSDFEELWKLYPRKQGKSNAFKDYCKAVKEGTTKEMVAEGIQKYLTHIKTTGLDSKYIKQGSTYFHQHSWEDEYEETQESIPSQFDLPPVQRSSEQDIQELLRANETMLAQRNRG